MPKTQSDGKSPSSRKPGSKFRIFIKTFLEDGGIDEANCGWLSVDPVEMVGEMSEAKVFTDREQGHGSAEDWLRFFAAEEPDWKLSVSWIRKKKPVRPSEPSLSSESSDS